MDPNKILPKFVDLASLPEDDRIRFIGETLMKLPAGKEQDIITDDETGKAGRYKRKLETAFPALEVTRILPGPSKGAVSLFVRKKPIVPENN